MLKSAALSTLDQERRSGPAKSPRKLSVLPVLPGKDVIEDMKQSVYLPRTRDFTSMRQERKVIEKAVNEGKEENNMHFSVVGSPDYMAVEVGVALSFPVFHLLRLSLSHLLY